MRCLQDDAYVVPLDDVPLPFLRGSLVTPPRRNHRMESQAVIKHNGALAGRAQRCKKPCACTLTSWQRPATAPRSRQRTPRCSVSGSTRRGSRLTPIKWKLCTEHGAHRLHLRLEHSEIVSSPV